ncbi:hypothetical protein ACFV9Z_36820, partial [Streptomyces sp. NPDC059883]|uniref:hypothetical protein n=1 Tax=Streptomyces sp. NPDC059883 TaxID=3346987 RepID=UPI003654CE9F
SPMVRNPIEIYSPLVVGSDSCVLEPAPIQPSQREHLLAAALACGIKGGQQQAEKCIRNGWARGQRGAMGGAA